VPQRHPSSQHTAAGGPPPALSSCNALESERQRSTGVQQQAVWHPVMAFVVRCLAMMHKGWLFVCRAAGCCDTWTRQQVVAGNVPAPPDRARWLLIEVSAVPSDPYVTPATSISLPLPANACGAGKAGRPSSAVDGPSCGMQSQSVAGRPTLVPSSSRGEVPGVNMVSSTAPGFDLVRAAALRYVGSSMLVRAL
jgi:hypothetical protein